jgi:hypothetical protein
METLSEVQAAAWCRDRGMDFPPAIDCSMFVTDTGRARCIRTVLPKESSRLIAMAHALLLQGLPEPDADDFSGALVWLCEWNIWSEASDAAGVRMLEMVRKGIVGTSTAPLGDAPAHLFGPHEFRDAHIVLLIPLLFQWDVYLIPGSANYVAFASHDGVVDLFSRSDAVLERIAARFRAAGW